MFYQQDEQTRDDEPFKMKSRILTKLFLPTAIGDEQKEPDMIIPGLYLSSLMVAMNPWILSKFGISRIVNVSGADNVYESGFRNGIKSYLVNIDDELMDSLPSEQDIEYHQIMLPDIPGSEINSHFNNVHDFLSQGNGNTLIHCQAGVSRSPTLIIAHLMRTGYTLDDAYFLVKSKRSIVRPNRGFCYQLLADYEALYPNNPTGCSRFKKEFDL